MATSILTISTKPGKGKTGIARDALIQIVLRQIEDMEGVQLQGEGQFKMIKAERHPTVEAVFTFPSGVNVSLKRDGSLQVHAKINVSREVNPAKACLELQERIVSSLYLATGREKIDVLLDLKGIGHAKEGKKARR